MKKSILVVLSVLALVAASIFGTLAYLTDTDTATNTFTVGQVQITLDELDVDNSTPGENDRDTANRYHLLPGHTYTKDPTVHVTAGSEDAYVRMLVTVKNIDKLKAAMPKDKFADFYNGELFLLQMLCDGWDANTWEYVAYTQNGTNGTYEFRYKEATTKSANVIDLPALFTSITVPGAVDNDGIKNLASVEIDVVAHAIQADGFADADAAWAAFN